jgi:hypothetical protein
VKRREPDSSTLLDSATHIEDDISHTFYTAGILHGVQLRFRVIDATNKFNDAVMHLDTDRVGGEGIVTRELGDNFLLNLHVSFHAVASMLRTFRMPPARRAWVGEKA